LDELDIDEVGIVRLASNSKGQVEGS